MRRRQPLRRANSPSTRDLRFRVIVAILAISVVASIRSLMDVLFSDDSLVAPVEDFRQVKSPVVDILSKALPPVLTATRAALARNQFGDYAVVQLLDKGYVDMTKHWICNVRKFDGVLDATVFLAMDEEAEQALRAFGTDLHVVHLPFKSAINLELRYGQVAYYELMELRTNLLLALLESDVSFMLVESDAYWARNALQEIKELGWEENSYDMISASDAMGTNALQGGFQLNRASKNSKVVWAKLAVNMATTMAKLRAKYGHGSTEFVAEQGSEQIKMHQLTSRGMRGGIFRLRFLPHDLVASGQWYSASKWKKMYPSPCVILNNWIEGNGNKIERALSYGHFFYDVAKARCIHSYPAAAASASSISPDVIDVSPPASRVGARLAATAVAMTINSPVANVLAKSLPPVLAATRAALNRNRYGNYAVIQLLDKGYVDMTKHWICNVRKFDGVLDATVFMAMDVEAEQALRAFGTDLHVVLLPFKTALNADLEYGQVAYYEMMELRTNLLLALLKNDVSFMLLESDAYWARNALQEINDLGWKENSYDMISASDAMVGNSLQGGFQLNRASKDSKDLWGQLVASMNTTMTVLRNKYGHGSAEFVAEKGSEQVKMATLSHKAQKYGTFKLRFLPHELVASGQWYNKAELMQQYPRPCVILNNWIMGNSNKISRALSKRHFFYDIAAGKCMYPAGASPPVSSEAIGFPAETSSHEGTRRFTRVPMLMNSPASMANVLAKSFPPVLAATRAALNRNRYGNYAVIQLLDKGYVDMTKHWICNVRKFDGVLDATVFLAMDQEAELALKSFDNQLHVVLLPFKAAINATLEYGQVAYYEMMELRTNLLLALLQNDVSFMLLESDAYWARNALQEINDLGWKENSYDMISASNAMATNALQGGFQLNRASNNSKDVWGQLAASMNKTMTTLRHKYGRGSTKFVAEEGSEQVKMATLSHRAQKNGTFKLRFLPHEVVASGQWYKGTEWKQQYPSPCVILNNWIVGNANKISRALSKRHFFYDIATGKCINQASISRT
jgi:hypothetical protein